MLNNNMWQSTLYKDTYMVKLKSHLIFIKQATNCPCVRDVCLSLSRVFAASLRRCRPDSGSDITGGSELGGRAGDVRAEELQSIIPWSHQTPDTQGGDGSHGSGRDQDMLPLHLPGVPLQCDPPDKLHHPVDPLQHPVQSGQYHHLANNLQEKNTTRRVFSGRGWCCKPC